jgi:hypothetical protein
MSILFKTRSTPPDSHLTTLADRAGNVSVA